ADDNRGDLAAAHPRLFDDRVPQDVTTADVEIERNDRKASCGQSDSKSAGARVVRPALECESGRERRRRRYLPYRASLSGRRQRQPSAPRVVPRQSEVPERSRCKWQIELPQPFLAKIEQRAFR